MASRKPAVMINGLLQDLPAADTLIAGIAGVVNKTITNGEASTALVLGAPAYSFAAGSAKRAQANALSTSRVIGLCAEPTSITAAANGYIIVSGVLTGTTAQWDAVSGGTGGLVFNTEYYLDPTTAGKITSTPPSAASQVVEPLGVALSTTDFDVQIGTPYLLA